MNFLFKFQSHITFHVHIQNPIPAEILAGLSHEFFFRRSDVTTSDRLVTSGRALRRKIRVVFTVTSKFSYKHHFTTRPALTIMTSRHSNRMSTQNLGVFFYSSLKMEKKVNHIIKTCFYHIRNIDSIRNYIYPDALRF